MLFKPRYQSPNYDERAGGQSPSMILIHYTGMQSAKKALKRLCDPAAKVSAHYVIDEKGNVFQLVADEKRAWHAGVSCWAGERDINAASIGIELVNKGHEFGYHAFPEAQIGALSFLCAALMEKYGISARRVLGHSDVAVARKIDPGHLFPWERLAEKGIGVWPDEAAVSEDEAARLLSEPERQHQNLVALGYDPEKPLPELMDAFHRHFYPERFQSCIHGAPEADILTCRKILALLAGQ